MSAEPVKARRWLVVSQYYAPEMGAPQIRLRCVVRELRRHGIAVEVLTALPNYPAGVIFDGYRGRWSVRETIDGVDVHRTWVHGATGKSARARLANYFSFTLSALLAVARAPRPDLIFLESQPLSLGVVGLFAKWFRGVPYVYNVPDLQVDVARQMGFLRNETLLKVATGLENLFLRRAERVSTVTEDFMRHFVGRGVEADRVTFLPNGADTEFLRPRDPDPALLERWGLRGKKVFLYVGTHAFYHGLDTLIEAAEKLKDRGDLAFLLVGDGPERPRLKRLAEEKGLKNVVFGASPYDEMDRLYSIAWASVATLRNIEVAKGMRLSKIFPSLSCAVPVVYAGAGEAAGILRDRRCGVVTPPEDSGALAAALAALADDPARRAAMGRAGRDLVLADYSWKTIVERWLEQIGWMGKAEESGDVASRSAGR